MATQEMNVVFRVLNPQAATCDRICRFKSGCWHGPNGDNCPFYHLQRVVPREAHMEHDRREVHKELAQCKKDIKDLQHMMSAVRKTRTRRQRRLRRTSGSSEEYKQAANNDSANPVPKEERKDSNEFAESENMDDKLAWLQARVTELKLLAEAERKKRVDVELELNKMRKLGANNTHSVGVDHMVERKLAVERKLVVECKVEHDKEVTELASQLAQESKLVAERNKEVTELTAQLAQKHKLVVERDKEVTALASQLAQERKLSLQERQDKLETAERKAKQYSCHVTKAVAKVKEYKRQNDALEKELIFMEQSETVHKQELEAVAFELNQICGVVRQREQLLRQTSANLEESSVKVTGLESQLANERTSLVERDKKLEFARDATGADNMSINANVHQTKYSNKFQEIWAMVGQGKTPDDVQEIDDMPPDPHAPPTESVLSQPQKPFESGDAKRGLSWFEQYEAQQETRDNAEIAEN